MLDTLLDTRRDLTSKLITLILQRKSVEKEIAVAACPFKLGQTVSYVDRGNKIQAFVTLIEFRPNPPYYRMSISYIDRKTGSYTAPRVVKQIDLLIAVESDCALLDARLAELISRGAIKVEASWYSEAEVLRGRG
jgi:hypothetical protein